MGTPTFPTSPRAISASESYPVCVGRSNATDNPVWPFDRFVLNRALVAAGVANPAYVRKIQGSSRGREPGGP